jgi:hypothetical protein
MHAGNSANMCSDLTPMGKEEAARLTDRYLAGFAYLTLPDPRGYQAALIAVLVPYPKWAGMRVIERADPDRPNLPASAFLLRKWLEELVRPYRRSREWDKRSAEQLQERKLLAAPEAKPKQSYEDFKKEMAACGLPIDGKDRGEFWERPEEVLKKYGITQEQWSAIPPGVGPNSLAKKLISPLVPMSVVAEAVIPKSSIFVAIQSRIPESE